LFILIALFARIGFIDSETSFFQTIIGIISILIGATIWWLTLTFIVSHFRSKIGMHQLKAINRITGGLIALIGCIGLVSSLI
jgi:small neutral amino acid transporter SnatA (MarC family)